MPTKFLVLYHLVGDLSSVTQPVRMPSPHSGRAMGRAANTGASSCHADFLQQQEDHAARPYGFLRPGLRLEIVHLS
jgi:hypothetical protein